MSINYGYIRVSTVNQSTDVQRYEIAKYCDLHNIKIDKWVDETISGTKKIQNRKLKYIVDHAKKGDCIICTEVSRLGRSMQIISEIMSFCVEHGVVQEYKKLVCRRNGTNITIKIQKDPIWILFWLFYFNVIQFFFMKQSQRPMYL